MNARFLIALTATVALTASTFAKTGWVEDFEKGMAKAKAENKPAIVDFTGSDWCSWCIKLDEEVFSKAKFKEYIKDKYVLVEVDFPQTKRVPEKTQAANKAFAEKHKVTGYPTVVVLSPDGAEIGRLGYVKGGPEAFIAELEKRTTKK